MGTRLSPLIHWPECAELWSTMPECFQYSFGKRITVIIDFFEIFIEKPSNLLAQASHISFVSHAWGGRTSDKFLTEKCGILDKLVPGDIVMADRGFAIHESVAFKRPELVIPAFTKGKKQLDPLDVEKTRGIANVRIHVERVIGLLQRKYTILQGTLYTEFLMNNPTSPTPVIDHILRVFFL